MNILIFSWRGPGHPLAGGAEQVTWAHARGWLKAGHKVTLFTSTFLGCKFREELDGIEIIRKGIDIFGVQLCAFWWYLFQNHPKYDLVVDEFHGIPFFTPMYVRTQKLGFIHEVAQKVWGLNPWPKPFNLIPAIVGRLGEPLVFKFLYTRIPFITVSESTKRDLLEFGIKDITIIHNGVNLPNKLPKYTKEKIFTVMFLSTLTKDKGIEDAITAFKKFVEKNSNSQMWIAGKGEENDLKLLKHLTRNYPIKFFGYVTETKKFDLLSRAHVLVNPSVHEGWGLVNLEANAVGTPIVGYKVSGMVDSVKNGITGILCDPKDIDGLAQNIHELKINNELYSKMSANCKENVSQYRWNIAIKKSLSLLKRLTKRQKAIDINDMPLINNEIL